MEVSEYRWALDAVAVVVGAIEAALSGREGVDLSDTIQPYIAVSWGNDFRSASASASASASTVCIPVEYFHRNRNLDSVGFIGFFFLFVCLLSSSKMVWASQCVFYKMVYTSDVSRST